MRLVVTAIMLALVVMLAPIGHQFSDQAASPRKSSSQGHDPAEKAPKKEETPRKAGEKFAVRQASSRRSAQRRDARLPALAPQPSSTHLPAALDDISRFEHLRLLARPVVLQVFRN
ncbi:hypothetical protein JNUCC0626_48115 [Lentzea sp. JNUCC 0626]|uniref:hypothetical protein n=1 Tax=Lentzea sp. JNUCC 0626 TaxID=3367513 RepID=UPI003748901A